MAKLMWSFVCEDASGIRLETTIEGTAPEVHRLPYTKTDGSGTFPVSNASLARAQVKIAGTEVLETGDGAVLEMPGP